MGKKGRKGSGKKGRSEPQGEPMDVLSDPEDGPGSGDMMYDKADYVDINEDAKLVQAIKKSRNAKMGSKTAYDEDDVEDVYGLSDDDDVKLPELPKAKKDSKSYDSDLDDEPGKQVEVLVISVRLCDNLITQSLTSSLTV